MMCLILSEVFDKGFLKAILVTPSSVCPQLCALRPGVDGSNCSFYLLSMGPSSLPAIAPSFSKELPPSPVFRNVVNCHTLSTPNPQLQWVDTLVSQTRVLGTHLLTPRKMPSCLQVTVLGSCQFGAMDSHLPWLGRRHHL